MTDGDTIELRCTRCGRSVLVYCEDYERDPDAFNCPWYDCDGQLEPTDWEARA